MQLYAGRSADQWRGFAALDPPSSEQPPAWHDSTRGDAACQHQHRSDNDRGTDAEYVGLRRERDDESGNARDDGAGERNGSRGNAGRIGSSIAIGLLRGKIRFSTPSRKTADASDQCTQLLSAVRRILSLVLSLIREQPHCDQFQ
jgi:hypothetical protein